MYDLETITRSLQAERLRNHHANRRWSDRRSRRREER